MANYSNRLEKLEAVVFAEDESERLSIWRNLVAWKFWRRSLPVDANLQKIFEALPKDDPIRVAHSSIFSLPMYFFDLPGERDRWWAERVQIAFEVVVDVGIDTGGLNREQLSTTETMADAIEFVNRLLSNRDWWDWFYERKRAEHEADEKRHLYRRLAREGQLTPDAAAWLKERDADFLENMRMKLDKPDLDSLVAYLSANARPPDTPAAAAARIAPRIEQLYIPPPPPEPEPTPAPAAPVEPNGIRIGGMWSGVDEGWLIDTLDGVMPVHRGHVYYFSPEKWAEMKENYYYTARWKEIKNG